MCQKSQALWTSTVVQLLKHHLLVQVKLNVMYFDSSKMTGGLLLLIFNIVYATGLTDEDMGKAQVGITSL